MQDGGQFCGVNVMGAIVMTEWHTCARNGLASILAGHFAKKGEICRWVAAPAIGWCLRMRVKGREEEEGDGEREQALEGGGSEMMR
jgi:hypothetical protein